MYKCTVFSQKLRKNIPGGICRPVYMHLDSADEICALERLERRMIDACGFARLDAVKQPRHIAPECAHGLQTLEVLLDVLRVCAVDHVPVLAGDNRHMRDAGVLE